VFADGFAAVDPIVNTSDAVARPMGLARGPDGVDLHQRRGQGEDLARDVQGDRESFGTAQLARMETRKQQTHIRTPDEENDVLGREVLEAGAKVYEKYCVACHQRDGKGDGSRFPPLFATDWVSGNKSRLVSVVLNGFQGEIDIEGRKFNGVMPAHAFLSDELVAQLLTFLRQNFGNNSDRVDAAEVAKVRGRPQPP
jgi:mono/diheme cytochrome c family protein